MENANIHCTILIQEFFMIHTSNMYSYNNKNARADLPACSNARREWCGRCVRTRSARWWPRRCSRARVRPRASSKSAPRTRCSSCSGCTTTSPSAPSSRRSRRPPRACCCSNAATARSSSCSPPTRSPRAPSLSSAPFSSSTSSSTPFATCTRTASFTSTSLYSYIILRIVSTSIAFTYCMIQNVRVRKCIFTK